MKVYYTHVASPVGPFFVAGTDQHLMCTGFSTGYQQRSPKADWTCDPAPLSYAIEPISDYFEGSAEKFQIPLSLEGPPFYLRVWNALQAIPFGETCSYGEIAASVRNPKASRAVGAANRANYFPIIIPCHRVVGANGQLTGFGGGLDTKARLLELERRN